MDPTNGSMALDANRQLNAWETLLETAFVGDVLACSTIADALVQSGAADVSKSNA